MLLRSLEGGGLRAVSHIAGDGGSGPGSIRVRGDHVVILLGYSSIGSNGQDSNDGSLSELHFECFAEAIDFGR